MVLLEQKAFHMLPYEDDLIRRAAKLMRAAKRAVAFTGAGISTASGIPDFRSPHSGLWQDVDPLAVASIFSFRQNPERFYEWIYPLARLTARAEPNPAHFALAEMEQRGYIKAVITQNIDMLHGRAGSKNVFELHGHMREVTCIDCFKVYEAKGVIERFLEDRQVPRCLECGGVLKPNVILFGEQLPAVELIGARNAASKTDLMLVIGSSLEVAPASQLPLLARRNGARLIIVNFEPTFADPEADLLIRADAARVLPQIIRCMETVP
ncbi:MAG: SIR2 family NAD-dependent protein deacylase [Aggregatilineales bacterium]